MHGIVTFISPLELMCDVWCCALQLDTAACELQLLYSDMTEEAIRGPDFTDLLSKGHLALAAGVAPPYVGMMLQGGCQLVDQ